MNSSRGNKDFGPLDYNGIAGNQNSWKGDVARSLFYMAVRYNLLSLVNGNPDDVRDNHQMGDLATLLEWNTLDRADDFEMNRNNYIQTWQYNRNPFIDFPALADYIWGNRVGEVWNNNLSNNDFEALSFVMYPNPTTGNITISGIENGGIVQFYDLLGKQVATHKIEQSTTIPIAFESGVYLVKITSNNKTATQKLIVK